ncbi:ATPase [Microlunatus elymi]|uniref:ATPase n=2 Tax=Microlunatus elymi TaxID=2596828 RepID=A0A516Q5U7_9ACTN|nr:ATPase [Microlunatus elymi]
MTDDQLIRSRTIPAAPDAVFAVLRDPARHPETEPTDWVRSAIDPRPITEVGQVFGMNMYARRDGFDPDYVMHNQVIAFEEPTTIAWRPGQYGPDGTLGFGGWSWRYDLTAQGDNCVVTLTYDWSQTPQQLRELFGLPPFGPDFLDQSLECLERAVNADRVRQPA